MTVSLHGPASDTGMNLLHWNCYSNRAALTLKYSYDSDTILVLSPLIQLKLLPFACEVDVQQKVNFVQGRFS